jgi:hypothetical protein
MATVNLGSIKFNWKGTYAGATAYKIDDVVEYNGSSYISIQAGTGNLPTDTAYWELMSQKGTNGTDGTDLTSTLTTQGDILYRDGSGLQRLGAGTAGQALVTGGAGANPSWSSVGGTNTPMFRAGIGSNTIGSGSTNTQYKLPLGTEEFDVGGCYNATSSTQTLNGISVPNYSFAPNVAGKYFLFGGLRLDGGTINTSFLSLGIRKNGSTEVNYTGFDQDAGYYSAVQVHGIAELNGTSDYVHLEYTMRDNWYDLYLNNATTFFAGFKIIE